MNILFALHGDIACNSAYHIDGLARELVKAGHKCHVTAPERRQGRDPLVPRPYGISTFQQLLSRELTFPNGKGPDIVHCWTPRERLRKLTNQLKKQYDFKLVIHLEDNEDVITRGQLSEEQYLQAEEGTLPFEYPEHLSHPIKSKDFLDSADAVSLLIDTLGEFVTKPSQPKVTFWPGLDRSVWYPRPRNDSLREKYGIGDDELVLVYHGNIHHVNFKEVRSLYLAVALLNENGIKARLVRTGGDYFPVSAEFKSWEEQFCLHLGFIETRQELANILAMADMFVQPGKSDLFNNYRFPSKVPEFFSLGRPVILPETNVGLVAKHLEHAFILSEANGSNIASAVAEIWEDKDLKSHLSQGSQSFQKQHFCWKRSAETLENLYTSILNQNNQENRMAS
ncbi:Glycosyl transferase group 1 [Planctomycetales bacterium 10988]|nr:Glycosyl transferase group 1 [Planctomycetales bacterium 10988]